MREHMLNELARIQDCMAVCAPQCAEVTESENAWQLSVELPGVSKEDLQLNVSKEGIDVSVGQSVEKEEKESYAARYASFHQHWPLPNGVNPDLVTAVCENGILKIMVPKPEKAKARRVSIQ